MNIKQILNRIADTLGGYQRIRCPHCTAQVRFRGCDDAETKRLRTYMHDHINNHTA
jgi:hypothetical protein